MGCRISPANFVRSSIFTELHLLVKRNSLMPFYRFMVGLVVCLPSIAIADSMVVAHRGLFQHAPENTMSAFEACLKLGIGIEVDVRRSKDGHLVCVHDSTVNRTTNGSGHVARLTLAPLQQLDAGSWFDRNFNKARIPTMEQIFRAAAKYRDSRFLIAIDLKAADIEVDVVKLANRYKLLPKLLFIGSTITSPAVRRQLFNADDDAHIATVAHDSNEFQSAVVDPYSDWVYFRYIPNGDEIAKAHRAGRQCFIAGKNVAGQVPKNWRHVESLGMDAVLTDFPLQMAEQQRQIRSQFSSSFSERTQHSKGNAMDQMFQQIVDKYLDQSLRMSPVYATSLGDHRFDGVIDDVDENARRAQLDSSRHLLEQLKQLDRQAMSRDNQVDYLVLKQALEKSIWNIETLRDWQWNPLVYTNISGSSLYSLMARDYAPIEKRLASATARLRQLPRFYAQVREALEPKLVPPIHAETAAKQHRGILSIIDNMIRPQMKKLPETDRKQLESAIQQARKAIDEHGEWIENELTPNAAGDFRLGPRLYDEKLAHILGTPMTRPQIRDLAKSELRRVRAEMYTIARPYYEKQHPNQKLPDEPESDLQQTVIESALELAYAEIPERDRVVESAVESMKVTTDFVKQHDLVTVPSDPLEIIIMPEFQRGVSFAYCDSPGALEVGQKTFYAVAPLPENWTEEQGKSFLREYNIRSIHNLTIHEAMPGHFLQLAHSNRHPSKIRAVLWSGTFVEGWACYTEQVMSDAGFLGDDPLMRLVMYKWYLRSIANSIMDQSIHVDGMRRPEAMKLMMQDTFQEEREAAAKWVRAQLTSTQLSTYFVGLHEHFDLRESAKQAWGDDFTLKRYHDAVISHGSPPAKFVKALLLNQSIE